MIEDKEGLGQRQSVYGCRLTEQIPISTVEKYIAGHYSLSEYCIAEWLAGIIVEMLCLYLVPT
jgi:hypothetical protein